MYFYYFSILFISFLVFWDMNTKTVFLENNKCRHLLTAYCLNLLKSYYNFSNELALLTDVLAASFPIPEIYISKIRICTHKIISKLYLVRICRMKDPVVKNKLVPCILETVGLRIIQLYKNRLNFFVVSVVKRMTIGKKTPWIR